jgi:hypothetical protein
MLTAAAPRQIQFGNRFACSPEKLKPTADMELASELSGYVMSDSLL